MRPPGRAPQRRTIQRKIRFYRVFTERDGSAIARLPLETIPLAIASIGARRERYVDLGDGVGVDCEPFAQHRDRVLMRRVHRDDPPERYTIERGPRDLRLGSDESLSDPAHLRFFDGNILAAEMTRSGPAPTMLREFLHSRFPDQFGKFQMLRIPDARTMERLARLVTFKAAKIQLSEQTLHRLPVDGPDYFSLLRSMGNYGGTPGVFEVSWRLFRSNGDLNAEAIRQLAIGLIEQEGEHPDSAVQIQIEGLDADGNPETFTLQRDFLSAAKMIRRGNNRRVISEDAFRALGDAYNEVLDRIPPFQALNRAGIADA